MIMPCPVCGSEQYKELFQDCNRRDALEYEGAYVECKFCSLVYLLNRASWEEIVRFYSTLDPEVTTNSGKTDIDELKQQIDKPVSKLRKLLRQFRFRPHSYPLESVPYKSKRILDLGCGNGSKLAEFAKRGYEIWGVDVSKNAIEVSQNILPEGHFLTSELSNINLTSNYFDYIRIDNALEHTPRPREVIKECYRLLKTGGQLLIYVPHGKSMSMRIMKGDSISSWIPFHLQLFTPGSLGRLMSGANFKNIQIYNFSPNTWLALSIMQRYNRKKAKQVSPPAWLVWTTYPLGWLASKFGIGEELIGIGQKTG